MTTDERRRRPERPGDDPLVGALHRLGAEYEPDIGAMRRRMREGGPSLVVRDVPRTGTSARVPALLSAAAMLLVVGGIVTVARDPGPPRDAAIAAGLPSPTTTPTTVSTVGEAVATTASPVSSPSAARTVVEQPRDDPDPEPTSGAPAADVVVAVDTVPVRGTRAVDLGTPPLLAWLAVGVRSDLKQVRSEADAGDPQVSVRQSGSARSTDGPFRVSWRGGAPEESHADADEWLAERGEDGLTVSIAPSGAARTVTLYAGARDRRATLTVRGRGLDEERTVIGSTPGFTRGFVITVQLPPTTGPVTLTLGGERTGIRPATYLAAVSVAGRGR